MASGESNTLSVEVCRRLLGGTAEGLSDDQIARVRNELYALAHIAVMAYEKVVARGPDAVLQHLPPAVQESIEERAAVLEFDAGMTRIAATRSAVASHFRATRRTK